MVKNIRSQTRGDVLGKGAAARQRKYDVRSERPDAKHAQEEAHGASSGAPEQSATKFMFFWIGIPFLLVLALIIVRVNYLGIR